jgi:hypothetical protein
MKIFLFILSLLPLLSFAQDSTVHKTRPKSAVYLQALGNGGFASVLYDVRFKNNTEGGLGCSVGIGMFWRDFYTGKRQSQ